MEFVKVNEAARLLGVSEAWMRRSEGRAGIPRAKRDINGWRVYSREDIAALRALLVPATQNEPRRGHGDGDDERRAAL